MLIMSKKYYFLYRFETSDMQQFVKLIFCYYSICDFRCRVRDIVYFVLLFRVFLLHLLFHYFFFVKQIKIRIKLLSRLKPIFLKL